MNANLKITDITHDDLVNLFSTAFTYNYNWAIEYNTCKYKELFNEEDCVEDKLAKIILNGGTITVYDLNSEDENEKYGDLKTIYKDGKVGYILTLNAIAKGIERAFNGNFKCYCDEYFWTKKVVVNMLTEGDYDAADSNVLIQIILFNEIIY